jgi:HAD superfamily hydrolase (TIGR01509 family)
MPRPALAALFDMDGLLIDSERVIRAAWLAVAHEAGIALTQERYAAVIGRHSAQSDAVLAEVFGGDAPRRAAQARVNERLARQVPAERFPLKPGAARVLAALRALGVPCAVASSSARHEIEERLAAVGVRRHFAAVAGGDEVPAGKPDPAVYRLAAQRLCHAPGECLAFEDSRLGAQAALGAGARLVLVPDLVPPTAELAARCLCVLGSLDEALPQVSAWFRPGRETS